MKPRITEIVSEMEKNRHERYVAVQLGLAGELMALVSEEQAASAAKLERFTRWLVGLTVALLLLTAFLSYDAYQAHKDPDFQNQSTTQE